MKKAIDCSTQKASQGKVRILLEQPKKLQPQLGPTRKVRRSRG